MRRSIDLSMKGRSSRQRQSAAHHPMTVSSFITIARPEPLGFGLRLGDPANTLKIALELPVVGRSIIDLFDHRHRNRFQGVQHASASRRNELRSLRQSRHACDHRARSGRQGQCGSGLGSRRRRKPPLAHRGQRRHHRRRVHRQGHPRLSIAWHVRRRATLTSAVGATSAPAFLPSRR